jgi:hypothetical protein
MVIAADSEWKGLRCPCATVGRTAVVAETTVATARSS